jgi:hypothetical protein
MYRRPKFLERLLEIRCEMALEADYDVDLFVELARSNERPAPHETTPVGRRNRIHVAETAEMRKLIGSRDG